MKVIDNFLSDKEFNDIKNKILEGNFPWYFSQHVATTTDFGDCYFFHTFYNNFSINSDFFYLLKPIINKLDAKALIRCRVLHYVSRKTFIEHEKHVDYTFPHKVCVLYINKNNGFTRLHDNSCVHSIENRALIFDGSLEHNSTNCTDTNARLVLTINYF